MKIVVAVVVYNRIENVKLWIKCWKLQTENEAELVIIHNNDGLTQQIQTICSQNSIRYISRKNIGYDIGALQDVALGRLVDFPAFDYLIWCTDDVLPMRKDFISQFAPKDPDKVYCMEISKEIRLHIRTTGFCISKKVLQHIVFPADPITTKEQCYQFEHRSKNTLYDQVGVYRAIQVGDIEQSPFWDTGHKSKLAIRRFDRRQKEFNDLWNTKPVVKQERGFVTVVCPIYNSFPEIISSMINQTHKEWELLLIHDGPNSTGLKKLIEAVDDPRIKYSETPVHAGDWGHSIRSQALKNLNGHSDFVVITNADNHHVPGYLMGMLHNFPKDAVASYCSHMVHNYIAHGVIKCRLERGYIDCAGVMVRAEVAKAVGWNNVKDHSADWLYFSDIARHYGWQRFNRVEGCLLIHN